MNIIMFIECAYGMPGPESYVREMCSVLEVSFEDDVEFQSEYYGLSCYLIYNVNESRYKSTYEGEISDIAFELFRDGFIEYFYIGEYTDIKLAKEKLVKSLNTIT